MCRAKCEIEAIEDERAMSTKVRLDKRLVDLGLAPSRERAQALIIAGQVVVGDHAADKPGRLVDETVEIRLKGEALPYVSRGGLKLAHALDAFGIDPAGRRALDVGASTGGFTDVLLQRGAASVIALDVAYGGLHWRVRKDERGGVGGGAEGRPIGTGGAADQPRPV